MNLEVGELKRLVQGIQPHQPDPKVVSGSFPVEVSCCSMASDVSALTPPPPSVPTSAYEEAGPVQQVLALNKKNKAAVARCMADKQQQVLATTRATEQLEQLAQGRKTVTRQVKISLRLMSGEVLTDVMWPECNEHKLSLVLEHFFNVAQCHWNNSACMCDNSPLDLELCSCPFHINDDFTLVIGQKHLSWRSCLAKSFLLRDVKDAIDEHEEVMIYVICNASRKRRRLCLYSVDA